MRRFALALASLLLVSCGGRARTYDTDVELLRIEVLRTDDTGAPQTVDYELQFESCPGDQRKTIRGDKEFAKCMSKHKQGDIIQARLSHERNEHGDWVSHVTLLDGCEHKVDPDDESSFEIVQVCNDLIVSGANVGFRCNRKPSKQLLEKCPWFRRH